MVNFLANRHGGVGHAASLLKVFWPYLTWNTVFDNARVISELAQGPAKFSTYGYALLVFSRKNKFRYAAKPWPEGSAGIKPVRKMAEGVRA
jgi:hypothetical protein